MSTVVISEEGRAKRRACRYPEDTLTGDISGTPGYSLPNVRRRTARRAWRSSRTDMPDC